MLRIIAALLLAFSFALPGGVPAASGHHAEMAVQHSGHAHHGVDQTTPSDDDASGGEQVMLCCAMMAGHCSSVCVPPAPTNAVSAVSCGSAGLSMSSALALRGRTFEADPPPPRT